MKALSVRQPWAWAIVHGTKRVENRSWTTSYRGDLAIHASAKDAGPSAWDIVVQRDARLLLSTVEYGAIIGTVRLVDVVPRAVALRDRALRRWVDDSSAWCWIVDDARPLATPIVMHGRLGLFDVTIPRWAKKRGAAA